MTNDTTNRADAIAAFHASFGPDTSLPDACISVHMSITGGSDPMRSRDLERAVLVLEARLATWTESPRIPLWVRFDNAIRDLVVVTIEDAKLELERRVGVGWFEDDDGWF